MKINFAIKATIFMFIAVVITAFSNKSETYNSVKENPSPGNSYNLNLSILLDLSDRISPTKYPGLYKYDLGYINSVADAFVKHVKQKQIVKLNDQMQVYFEPAPRDPKINSLAQKLKIKVNKSNVTKSFLASVKPIYQSNTSQIYNLAIKNNEYYGSDIWGFFNSKCRDYCIRNDSKNVLVILTDGYMYHKDKLILQGNKSSYITPDLIKKLGLNKSDYQNRFNTGKYGFIKNNNGDLSKLKVMVLGLNPSRKNPFDEYLLKLYWSKWFQEMGIKDYQIHTSDLPINMNDIIADFILN